MGDEPKTATGQPMRHTTAAFIGVAWFSVALSLGAAGVFEHLRPPVPQLVLFGLTALLILAGIAMPPVRLWALGLDPRVVVALHLTRFVGVYFLILYGRGELPYAFAVPGGWGDIAVATLALPLLATVNPYTRTGHRLFFAWNVLGSIDILGVVATAATQAMADPESMGALLRLPLNLLITFLVPLIIASHVLLFAIPGRERKNP